MTDPDTDLSQERFPWLRSGFALEGWVGALAAWLVGILLAIIWSPLFWIGFAGAILVLMATRTVKRAPPRDVDVVVSPTDGVVVSINAAVPPPELKLEGDGWTRLRISKGPNSPVGIYAPMDGALDHIVTEIGDPAAFAATKPDRPGLSAAFVSFASGGRTLGMRLATGGLGPRLEMSSEPGDGVRVGRQIGLQRLGGWCDLYLPASAKIRAWPGETLIAAETVLAKFEDEPATPAKAEPADTSARAEDTSDEAKPDAATASVAAAASATSVAETVSEPVVEADPTPDSNTETDDKPTPTPKKRSPSKRKPAATAKAKTRAKPAPKTEKPDTGEPAPDDASAEPTDSEEEDVSEMLARLRAESEDGDGSKSS